MQHRIGGCSVLYCSVLLAQFLWVGCTRERSSAEEPSARKDVRTPVWDGKFYPGESIELSSVVDSLLDKAKPWEGEGIPIAIICPHAGYVYSGETAAHAFRTVEEAQVDTVVLLGSVHHRPFQGISIYDGDAYGYPGGFIDCDKELADRIRDRDIQFLANRQADAEDHVLEVMIPFLAKVLPHAKIVPILIGHVAESSHLTLARAILDGAKGKRILLLASTDLSHYPRSDAEATRVDQRTLESWKTMDVPRIREVMEEQMASGVPQLACTMCSYPALFTAIEASKMMGAQGIHVFPYTNSARVSGQEGRVVGYGAALIYGSAKGEKNMESPKDPREEPSGAWKNDYEPLPLEAQREAIGIARGAIECALRGEKWRPKEPLCGELKEARGCFVTLLYRRDGGLRGCIGIHETSMPLYHSIGDRAIQAAFKDPRFPPLAEKEWPLMKMKISVYLSRVKPIDDPNLFVPGRFGILFRKGMHGSTFLPEVAVEQGWSREETFQMLARKAGLSPNDWRNGQFSLYTTQIIDADAFEGT